MKQLCVAFTFWYVGSNPAQHNEVFKNSFTIDLLISTISYKKFA